MGDTGRVVVVGMEVGDGRLILDGCRSGRLPVMRSLVDQGTWGWLKTTAETLHVSAWPSIYTGSSPGEHGVYFTFQPAPGLQGYRRFQDGQYGRPTFWALLSQAGFKCTVFDAPYTHPEDGFCGTQILDWGTWAKYLGPSSTPPSVLKELQSRFVKDPIGLEAHDIGLAALDSTDMKRRLVSSVKTRTDAALWLMDQSPWEMFFVVFGETHPAAHYCWDPLSSTSGPVAQESLLQIYEQIDEGLGKILRSVDEKTTVLVVSGDGVGPNHSGWYLLPELLRRMDFLVEPSTDSADSDPQPGEKRRKIDPVRFVRDLMPKDLRKAIARQLPKGLRDKLAQRVDTANIDWSRTRAYCLPTDLEGCIRINLAGREPEGVVAPGEEYERVCTDLREALLELVDPKTGEQAVSDVVRTDREYPGPKRHDLPDLIVLWSRERKWSRVSSAKLGRVEASSPDERPGTHSPPGFIAARGPGFPAGTTLEGAHIYDVAPTVLSCFDATVPSHMAGNSFRKRS